MNELAQVQARLVVAEARIADLQRQVEMLVARPVPGPAWVGPPPWKVGDPPVALLERALDASVAFKPSGVPFTGDDEARIFEQGGL